MLLALTDGFPNDSSESVVVPVNINSKLIRVLGDHSERVTPVPIPNTAVKPLSPDGTARASVWESRTLPD